MAAGRKMAYTIIELAVDKGLQDMREDLHRGVRNLVDLGSVFAQGNLQQDFFERVKTILKNKKSPYFSLISHFVHNVDHRVLKTCGINLGYNSWIYGAKKIRKYGKAGTANIPWFLVFDFRQRAEAALAPAEISAVLTSAKELGIYCGIFFVNKEFELEALIPVLSEHRDNIFLLFAPAESETAAVAESVVQAANIILVLETDPDNYSWLNKTAAELLFSKKCLYGAYTFYHDDNLDSIMTGSYGRLLENLKCPFAFLVRKPSGSLQKEEQFTEFLKQARDLKTNRFFLMDFYKDLSYVNQIISAQNPFLAIRQDGTVAFSSLDGASDGLRDGLNIKLSSLPDILQRVNP